MARPKEFDRRIGQTLRLVPKMHKAVRVAAKVAGVKASRWIEEAVAEKLAREKRQ